MVELTEQTVPSAVQCPYCGGDPEYDPKHVLSASGYIHDDIKYTCVECEGEWTSGVPIGTQDGKLAADLFCRSCQKRYGLVHRVEPDGNDSVQIHLKCPECYNFWKLYRRSEDGVILLGYPQITGDIDSAEKSYGHPDTIRHTQDEG